MKRALYLSTSMCGFWEYSTTRQTMCAALVTKTKKYHILMADIITKKYRTEPSIVCKDTLVSIHGGKYQHTVCVGQVTSGMYIEHF
jgi:hypothetical protein